VAFGWEGEGGTSGFATEELKARSSGKAEFTLPLTVTASNVAA
jgi:hypothetical protein